MKKFLVIAGGGVVLFLGALVVSRNDQAEVLVTPEVTVYRASETDVQKEHVFGATVKNADEVVLSAQLGGLVSEVFVAEGDKVKSGQLLIQIDADEYNAQHAQMKIALESAEQAEKLARRKWDELKPEQREQQKLEAEKARALVAESSAYLGKLRVAAPFEGIVSSKFVSRGAVVSPGTELMMMVGEATKKEIVVDVPRELGEELEVGDLVRVSDKEKSEDAKVSAINPVADTQTRKTGVKIELPADSSFGLGAFANAHFLIKTTHEGVRVPFEAVVRYYDDNFVFVVGEDNIVKMQKIELLEIESEHAVVSNIGEGAKVVVGGAHTLFDEDKVKIVGEIN